MKRKPLFVLWFLGAVATLFIATAAQAQCGTEASSCKNCHEVQAQDPVNNDGTGWHESHAFGDFCTLCHAGNQQATDKIAAHTGMENPLADTKASCQGCHPNDLEQRVAVYTAVLGTSTGAGSDTEAVATLATTPVAETTTATEQAAAAVMPAADETVSSGVCPPGSKDLAVDDPNLVDYVQHYNQVVLGEQPVNWGDLALIGLIVLVAVGGGGFVLFNETRLHRGAQTAIVEGEYPADVVEMLPSLASLKPQSRKSLLNILKHPEKSDKALGLLAEVVADDDQAGE